MYVLDKFDQDNFCCKSGIYERIQNVLSCQSVTMYLGNPNSFFWKQNLKCRIFSVYIFDYIKNCSIYK